MGSALHQESRATTSLDDVSLALAEEEVNAPFLIQSEPIAKRDSNLADIEQLNRRESIINEEYLARRNIEQFKMHTVELELNQGDTLVFVDFPAIQDCKVAYDCSGLPYRSQKFRVHSANLIATGSSKFIDMLKPSHQSRAQRQRNLAKLPNGIKYILDLTPPSEGDHVVFQMTELSLTPGIIKWWSSYARLNVPSFLVQGHDDLCSCKTLSTQKMPQAAIKLPLTAAKLVSLRNCGKQLQIEQIPDHFDIPDYCPIRHRTGILRLMMLIEGKGKEVLLDSAPRVWTLVALAKVWDCVKVVRAETIQWLLHGRNSQFIEVLPEEALRIGGTIESAQVTQTAFKILVNELALEEAASPAMKEAIDFNHVTVFGRRKGYAGDEFVIVIQHAARAMIERVTTDWAQLQTDILDDWKLPEWRKLQRIENALKLKDPDRYSIHLKLISELKNTIRSAIFSATMVMTQPRFDAPYYAASAANHLQVDGDRARYVEPQDFKEFDEIDRLLVPVQKLLLKYSYAQLADLWSDAIQVKHIEGAQSSANELARILTTKLEALYRDYVPGNTESCKNAVDGSGENWPGLEPDGHLFKLSRLEDELKSRLRVMGGRYSEDNLALHISITRHLTLALTNNETKYLPLWAGGCNDGTGGVFEDLA